MPLLATVARTRHAGQHGGATGAAPRTTSPEHPEHNKTQEAHTHTHAEAKSPQLIKTTAQWLATGILGTGCQPEIQSSGTSLRTFEAPKHPC